MKTLGWIILAFLFLPVLTRRPAGSVGTPAAVPSSGGWGSFLGFGLGAIRPAGNAQVMPGTVTSSDGSTWIVDSLGNLVSTTAIDSPSPAPGDIMQANSDAGKAAAQSNVNALGAVMPTVSGSGDTVDLSTFGI